MDIKELYQLFLSSKGISTDTRQLKRDTLFFALKGANFNGNEFAEKALNEGCNYAIIDEAEFNTHKGCILVDDVLITLQELARHHRRQFNIPVLGITGSNGKTTSKELIGSVLEKKYNVLITEGNLNNHLGVPFTLLKMKEEHEFAVIEMGANKPGDIKELCEIAEPNFGIITNIGAAHIEGFGSIDGVIKTKTELYRFIDQVQGELFVNADDPILNKHLPSIKSATYGENQGALRGKLIALNPFVLFSYKEDHYASNPIQTHLVGKYNFTNFLAAAAIGRHFGVPNEEIAAALANYTPSNNRSQVQKTSKNTLIVDCYNANPTSMNAAIESFEMMDAAKKTAILGDMLELGKISEEEHRSIVERFSNSDIQLITVGEKFSETTSKKHFSSVDELVNSDQIKSFDNHLILLKGSRGIKLEKLIPYL